MTRRFFSGKTLDQTVMMAARHYGIDPQELAYRQIEKKHGFLRTRKAVMIAVDPEQPRRQPEAASREPEAPEMPAREEAVAEPAPVEPPPPAPVMAAEPAEPAQPAGEEPEPEPRPAAPAQDPPVVASEPEEPAAEAVADSWPTFDLATADSSDEPPAEPSEALPVEAEEPRREVAAESAAAPARGAAEGDDDLLGAAEEATHTLMRFAGIEGEASAKWNDERVEVEVDGADSSVLVVEGGKGLLAIQHLLPRMMRGLTGRSSFVRVDSQGFHQNRRERLEALAVKEAEVASRNGTSRTLPPMAPDERRIVHLAVQGIPTVETESRGTGLHKRVVIRPVTGDGGHDDVEARHGF